MIIIIVWILLNLAMAILAGPHLVLNLLLERQDDKEEVVKDHPREDAADGGDMATDQEDEVVDDVQDEDDSSQHDPRFHEADVPLNIKIF